MNMLTLINFLILIIPVLVSVAFMTLAERKVLSLIGFRQGPNKVSIQGILQPIGDAMKLANKSVNYLSNFSIIIYYFSVMIMMVSSLMLWSSMSFMTSTISWKMSMLIIMLILGVASMKAILSGWSTYGKYPLIGSMRTVSQMISYESILYLCILLIVWISKGFSIIELKMQNMSLLGILVPLIMFFWIPSVLAELNRTPYDFSEGESELVSGFNTEFGSSSFTMIFLSEYSSIIFFMFFSCLLFMSSDSTINLFISVIFMTYWIIWVRSTMPRMRFDKFMNKAWKFYIPLATLLLLSFLLKF